MRKLLLLSLLLIISVFSARAQIGCGGGVPTFNVNLTGNPDSVWTSPNTARNGNCCTSSPPEKCIDFIITLDPGAIGITFNIISGAIPGGALYYQINCGPPQPLGSAICLSGPGPHLLTFCKPGSNANVYQITSIPGAVGGNDIVVNQGCSDTLHATGFQPTTVNWTSISPGTPGQYNSLLSCTHCTDPIATGVSGAPTTVTYQVCGTPLATCVFPSACDTVTVTFNPTLAVSIIPINPTICFGSTSTTITAVPSGGTTPYSFLWNSINPSPSITVGAGNYTVVLSDASGCSPVTASVTVTSFSVAITANAGPDQIKCSQGSPVVSLAGSVTGATGGIWSGGGGTFSPNASTLNATYTPTAAEIAAGSVTLTLTTTGNGTCPAATDNVTITFSGFTGTIGIVPVNVSCFGGNNGSATVSMTGGIPAFTYSWSTIPIQTGAAATNLVAGTYTVTVTSGIGCTATSTVTITQPTPLAVSSTITAVSCFGGNNGSVTAIPAGGTPSYTYLWSPGGATTATISGLSAGTYTVTVTDSKGCTITASYAVTQPTVLSVSTAQTNVSCSGGSNGSATATAAGGTPAYSYSWSPSGGTAATASGLAAGTYTVTVTDSKGCTVTATAVITQPTPVAASIVSTNETCDYLNNGTSTVTASGGTPAYSYSWTPGGMTTASVSSLAAGTYSVAVTDSKGCAITVFAVITQPPALAVVLNNTSVSCFGGSNGAVAASTSGGTPSYTYLWTPGGSSASSVSGVTAGTYSVTVTDANGCTISGSTVVTQPAAPLANVQVITNVSCNGGSDGSIAVTTSGGTPAYSYLWLPGGQTTSAISGQPAGTYTVTVTDSKGCQLTSTYTITQPLPLAISFSSVNVSCFGGSNGSTTGSVSGGTPGYIYSWTPSGGSGATASGLSAGTYTLTVTDAKGCTVSSSVTITQPVVLSVTTTALNETCDYLNNGSATATPSGGTPGYTYSWSPGGATGATASSLSAGTYTVTVTDTKGCTVTSTATVTQPTPLAIVFDTHVNVSCFGGSNGVLSATVSGGTPNYAYSWMPGGGTLNVFSGLAAGTYTLTITDFNGCVATNSTTITQPAAPVSAATASLPATCYGATNGSLSAAGAGGTPGYTYLWMPGALSGSSISGVGAGTYTVTATDANGCTGSATQAVTEPAQLILTTSTVNSNCGTPTGQASVAVAGGAPPYTYSWSPSGGTGTSATGLLAGAYNVTVTDANGCTETQWANVNDNAGPSASIFAIINVTCNGGSDGSASVGVVGGLGPYSFTWAPFGGTGTVATGLTAGSYTVTVTDANGCISNATTSPDVTEPPPIVTLVSSTPVSCFGGSNGSATAVASGGTPGYSYVWSPGAIGGATAAGLPVGTYTVQTTDNNGCTQTNSVAVVQPAAPVAVVTATTPVSCSGGANGTASSVVSGGTTPYSYVWTPGSITGPGISGMSAGTYTVTVSDLNNCTSSATATITQPTALVLATSSNNAACGTASGLAYVSASGGTPAYSYLWTPGGVTNDTASSLLPGTYSVSVTDNNGCTATQTILVNNTPGPVATISSITNVSCNGGANGSATVGIAGGIGPYNYSWSPSGGSAATASGLSAGSYTVNVTDANGCASPDTAMITQPSPVVVSVSTNNVSCFGGANGTASATGFGGTPGYTFLWMPGGATGSSVSGLSTGSYTVQATDIRGCTGTQTFSITQPTVVNATITGSTNVSCFGGANGTATASGSGGTPFYTYNWLPAGGTSATAVGLAVGTYTVTTSDANGCTASATVTITQPASALSASVTTTAASCNGGSNGTATVSVSGGTPGYTYLWSPSGGTGATTIGSPAGNYSALVTDLNGCNTNASGIITEPTAITGSLAVTDPSCGLPNGAITSMISGGTPGYGYLWMAGGATTPSISGLLAGSYSVTVTDNNSCTATFSATLTNIAGPSVSILSSTNATCFGNNNGTATAFIASGTPPYTVSWMPYGGSGTTATGLVAGTYTVSVADGLGCTGTATVTITEPAQLNLVISASSNVSCNAGANGSATVAASGGTPIYTYSWSPITSSSPSVSGLNAGTYTATVNDVNGCAASVPVVITQPAVLTSVSGTVVQPSCYNSTNGSVTLNVSGGTLPYNYSWSNGQTGNPATGLAAGSYSVTVTDGNGCTASTTTTLTQPTQIITTAGMNDTICLGQSGTVTAAGSGGDGGYYYVWQPGAVINGGTFNVTPVTTTNYTVTAYDATGCAGTPDTVSAIVYNLTAANIDALAFSPICPGQGTVVYAVTSGITGPLTYSWNNGLGSGPGGFLVTPSAPVTYVVTVTNSCGASVQDSVSITFNPQPTIVILSDTNSVCAPGTIQFSDLSVTGNPSDPIVGWLWNFGDGGTSTLQNPTYTYTFPGTYNVTLTVTTLGGCTNNNASGPYVVVAHPYPNAAFTQNSNTLDLPYDLLVLDNLSTGATSYLWNFGDGGTSTLPEPQYLYNSVGIYNIMLIATSAFGCSDTAYSTVTTTADVVFPNVFTPNPDGPNGGVYDITSLTNDVFFPYTSGVTEFKFEIFNRWGELIFVSNDIHVGWDGYYKGRLCQEDVYVWKALVKLNNGKVFKKTGDVTLLR
ncbi:MAG: PKD domain-containing protein [Bacteroidia bacterium]